MLALVLVTLLTTPARVPKRRLLYRPATLHRPLSFNPRERFSYYLAFIATASLKNKIMSIGQGKLGVSMCVWEVFGCMAKNGNSEDYEEDRKFILGTGFEGWLSGAVSTGNGGAAGDDGLT